MGFLCHHCGKEFISKQNYNKHLSTFHEEKEKIEDDHVSENQHRVVCSFCGKEYKRKDNLQKHISAVHKNKNKDSGMKTCILCNAIMNEDCFQNHLIEKHRPNFNNIADEKPLLNCPVCSVGFTSSSSLQYHKKRVHNENPNRREMTINCPLCDYTTKCCNKTEMLQHFTENHNITLISKTYQFNSFNEFNNWKNKMEKETTSKFIRTRTKPDVILYTCHRSGKHNPTTVKRNVRLAGSCKINGFCPAFMKVTMINEIVTVTYQTTHVGHINDLKHINLTPEERKSIAVEIANNTPYDDILNKIRSSLSDTPLQRFHLTNRKDINNIKKSFDLNAIAVEHEFNLESEEQEKSFKEEDSIAVAQLIDNEGSVTTDKSIDYNTVTIEEHFDIKPNIFSLATEHDDDTPSIEVGEINPSTQIDYNSLIIDQPFQLNSENVEITFVDQKIENDNLLENSGETITHIYEINTDSIKNTFDQNTEVIAFQNYSTENFDNSDNITEESVENLLEFKPKVLPKFLDHEKLEVWVQNLKASPNTSLVVYKPQGCVDAAFPDLKEEDFLLIFMTEAQKDILVKYCEDIVCLEDTYLYNLKLFALLVPDDTRDGFPVAVMFTTRGDELDLSIFFEKIKEVVGTVKSTSFMCNSDDRFYSTWTKVMGNNYMHTYSSWHVIKDWRTSICKIKLRDKRNQTYKNLQTLMYDLDEENFQNMLDDFLLKIRQEDDMSSFSEYFNLYVTNDSYKKWAYCFRINAGINASIAIDSFNRILKYCSPRDKFSGVEKTLCDVLNLLRVKLFEFIVKINKGKAAKKLQNLRLRHDFSFENDSEYVIQHEDKWQVMSYKNDEINETYIVKKIKNCKDCLLRCHQCNTCFHEYVCSCIDHIVKNNMCKHIHLVARTQKLMENQNNKESPSELDLITKGNENSKINEVGVEQVKDDDLPFLVRKRTYIEELKRRLDVSIESSEQLEFVKNEIQPIISSIPCKKFKV